MSGNAEAPGEAGNVEAGPGVILRKAREERELSIEDVAADLRIELHLLISLESEDYAALGAPVFARGYIRQYALRLGIDPESLVEGYTAAVGDVDVQIEPSRVIKLQDTQQVTVWIIALGALVVLVAFLAFWWLGGSTPDPASRSAGPEDGDGASALPPPVSSPATPAAGVATGVGQPATAVDTGLGQPATAVETGLERPAAAVDTGGQQSADEDVPPTADAAAAGEPQAVPADSDSADAAGSEAAPETRAAEAVVNESADPGTDAAAAAGNPDATASVADGPRIEAFFTAECWVEIVAADGQRLLFGLVEAGTTRSLTGLPPIAVLLGDVDAVELRVDGQDFTVPVTARRGNLARFTIGDPPN